MAKHKPTPSSFAPIHLSTTSTLRKLSESQTSDGLPGNSVSERTRKITNTSQIVEEDWIVGKEKMTNMKAWLMRETAPGAKKRAMQEMMEEYVIQCEKAIKTGKKADLPKMLQTKLEELHRARENQALEMARSTVKAAETEPTPSTTISTTAIAKAT